MIDVGLGLFIKDRFLSQHMPNPPQTTWYSLPQKNKPLYHYQEPTSWHKMPIRDLFLCFQKHLLGLLWKNWLPVDNTKTKQTNNSYLLLWKHHYLYLVSQVLRWWQDTNSSKTISSVKTKQYKLWEYSIQLIMFHIICTTYVPSRILDSSIRSCIVWMTRLVKDVAFN